MNGIISVWIVDEQGYPVTQAGIQTTHLIDRVDSPYLVLTPQTKAMKTPRWNFKKRRWENQTFGR